MIKIKQAIIVEGRYDKIKLSSLIDGLIIETDGFGIFKDKEKKRLIRRLADERGILIMTDSDSAGFKIRSYLGGSLPEEKVFHAYIPDVFGKERRKTEPSKEGKLGVEGVSSDMIFDALKKAGIEFETAEKPQERRLITNVDLFEHGLSGTADCKERKEKLLSFLSLPKRLSTKSFVKVLNTFMTYEDFVSAVNECFQREKENDLCE